MGTALHTADTMSRISLAVFFSLLWCSCVEPAESWDRRVLGATGGDRSCENCRLGSRTVTVKGFQFCPHRDVVITTNVCVGMCYSSERSLLNWEARICKENEFQIREFPYCDTKLMKIREATSCSCQFLQPDLYWLFYKFNVSEQKLELI